MVAQKKSSSLMLKKALETRLARPPRGLTPEQLNLYERIPSKVAYVDNWTFHSGEAEDRFFGSGAMEIDVPQWSIFPESFEDYSALPRKKRKLTAKEEMELFLRYQYARFRLAELIDAQPARQSLSRARKMCLWQKRAMETRSALACANMGLVLAMAKRTRIPNVEFGELISEGNMALLRSIEKFDVSRGFKFSTYACRAILKSFNRLATKTGRYRQHFPTEFDPDLEKSDYEKDRHDLRRQDSLDSLREIITQNRANLTRTEQTVVIERFAIGTDARKGRTLAEVGQIVGLTNERVRQIQNLALEKIRVALDEFYLVA